MDILVVIIVLLSLLFAATRSSARSYYEACKLQMTPAEDKVRVELSIGELLHLSSLAHLGFRKMMPNDRGVEMHRFEGEEYATAGTRAVERLEQAIPEQHPFGHAARPWSGTGGRWSAKALEPRLAELVSHLNYTL